MRDKSQPPILYFVGLDAATFLKHANTPHGAPFKCFAGLSAGQQPTSLSTRAVRECKVQE